MWLRKIHVPNFEVQGNTTQTLCSSSNVGRSRSRSFHLTSKLSSCSFINSKTRQPDSMSSILYRRHSSQSKRCIKTKVLYQIEKQEKSSHQQRNILKQKYVQDVAHTLDSHPLSTTLPHLFEILTKIRTPRTSCNCSTTSHHRPPPRTS